MRVLSPCCVLLLFFQLTFAQEHIPGQIIVQLNKEYSVDKLLQDTPALVSKTQMLSKSWNIWLLTFPQGDDEKILKTIQKIPQVKLAQFNHSVTKRSMIPNDTLFTNQWNLENTGQAGGRVDADIDAPEAWDLATGGVTALGDSIVIAIVDEGVDLNHEDLHFWKNRNDPHNGIDDDLNGYIDDYDGWNIESHTDSIPPDFHGTHVAGIAAAIGNNNIGIAGIAWSASILPVCITHYTDAEVAEAYSYIFDLRKLYNETNGAEGAFVVAANSSFGVDLGKPEDYPIWCAMYDSLGSVGVLSVGSTMNLTTDVDISGDIPSTCTSDYLIIVTNTTRYDNKNTSAAIGYTSVDLGAPGTSILSTVTNDGYVTSSGTSMAAPHVAGAIALMYSVACQNFIQAYHDAPDTISLIVKDYILKGTDILHDLDGLTVSGGRLNLYHSMNMFHNDFCVTCETLNATVSNVICNGEQNGAIDITASQGTPPYKYEWSTGDSTTSLTGLPRGKYFVKVTDSTGCEKSRYFEIIQPFPLVVNLISDSAVNGQNGSAAAFVTGGVQPYSYLWNDSLNSTNAILNDLPPGDYSVTVTDSNECQSIKATTVGNMVGINLLEKNEFEIKIYPNPVESIALIEIVSQKKYPVQLSLYDLSGKLLLEENFTGEEIVLDFSTYLQGSYFIKATTANSVGVKKIIRL